MSKSQDIYGNYGSVPTVENQGVSGAHESVQASPASFGGQVGEALTNSGSQAEQMGNHFLQMATEAKVNDDYANKYTPAAAQLRTQYDSLRGQDKIAGYDGYIKGLQDLNHQFVGSQPGIYGQQVMSGLVDRHITGEIEGAKSELVTSQKQFSDQATRDVILANSGLAARNYNNPAIVNSVENQNDNHILIQHIDAGHDPNDPQSQVIIKNAQDDAKANMATGIIDTALKSGDPVSANQFRSRYASVLPGYQKLGMDNTLHVANIQQTATNTIGAITAGQPVPQVVGAPASHVQALVADTAKTGGVDPNNALTVLRIESSNGQNLGARGTIGQDKESAGRPLEDQAQALTDNLKAANQKATDSLGRPAEPWEGYAVYQQGVAGGPALLKAAQENPNTKAIDVLTPLYKNRNDALSAITNNGGNITMTAQDFCDHIKQVYNDNAKRADCNFADGINPGDAIQAPHHLPGVAVQPGSSPVQSQLNFESKFPAMLDQVNSIPNYEVRAGVMKALNETRQQYQEAATAYKNNLVNQAGQLAVDPKFTDMKQIPPEMMAALATDRPQTLDYLEKKAEANQKRAGGYISEEEKTWGPGVSKVFTNIHASADNPNRITDPNQIYGMVNQPDGLTISGAERMVKELKEVDSPAKTAELDAKKLFFNSAKKQITGSDQSKYLRDPKGDELYTNFFMAANTAIDKGVGEGKSIPQLLDSKSPDYIGKMIPNYIRPQAERDRDTVYQPIAPTLPEKPGLISSAGDALKGAWNTATNYHEGATPPSPQNFGAEQQAFLKEAQKNNWSREKFYAEAEKRGLSRKKIDVPLAE